MSDRLIDENDVSVDEVKEQAIAKHMSDIKVMNNLIMAINENIIRFGRTSNVHDQLLDLKNQVQNNKDHLQDWINKI
tara:strand:+ start:999 stop:1229 length:231 start_codon:yes stop_codon:yes gene_type:complete